MTKQTLLRRGSGKSSKIEMINRYTLLVLLLIEFIVFSQLSPYFFTKKNLFAIGLNISVLGIVSIGQTLCILTSDFDLSVGNAAAFTGIMMGYFFERLGMGYLPAFILAMLVAVAIGAVNALLIAKLNISAFITTMATNFILGGMVILVSNGQAIIVADQSFGILGKTTLTDWKVPLPMVLFVAAFLIFAFLLRNTVMGRKIYCLGGNAQAAKIAGINVVGVKLQTFILSSALAGFAGIVLASRMNAAQISVGSTYGMESIAATVLGGTALSGGSGNMLGTFLGVLVTGILSNGLTMLGVNQAWRDIATGLLLIMAIILQNTTKSKSK